MSTSTKNGPEYVLRALLSISDERGNIHISEEHARRLVHLIKHADESTLALLIAEPTNGANQQDDEYQENTVFASLGVDLWNTILRDHICNHNDYISFARSCRFAMNIIMTKDHSYDDTVCPYGFLQQYVWDVLLYCHKDVHPDMLIPPHLDFDENHQVVTVYRHNTALEYIHKRAYKKIVHSSGGSSSSDSSTSHALSTTTTSDDDAADDGGVFGQEDEEEDEESCSEEHHSPSPMPTSPRAESQRWKYQPSDRDGQHKHVVHWCMDVVPIYYLFLQLRTVERLKHHQRTIHGMINTLQLYADIPLGNMKNYCAETAHRTMRYALQAFQDYGQYTYQYTTFFYSILRIYQQQFRSERATEDIHLWQRICSKFPSSYMLPEVTRTPTPANYLVPSTYVWYMKIQDMERFCRGWMHSLTYDKVSAAVSAPPVSPSSRKRPWGDNQACSSPPESRARTPSPIHTGVPTAASPPNKRRALVTVPLHCTGTRDVGFFQLKPVTAAYYAKRSEEDTPRQPVRLHQRPRKPFRFYEPPRSEPEDIDSDDE